MIVCKIEMWPGGDPTNAYDLGCIEITNEGGTAATADYSVRLTKSAKLSKRPGTTWKRGAVKRFPRQRLGAYDLLLRALANVVGDRNPDAADAASLSLLTVERQTTPRSTASMPSLPTWRHPGPFTGHLLDVAQTAARLVAPYYGDTDMFDAAKADKPVRNDHPAIQTGMTVAYFYATREASRCAALEAENAELREGLRRLGNAAMALHDHPEHPEAKPFVRTEYDRVDALVRGQGGQI